MINKRINPLLNKDKLIYILLMLMISGCIPQKKILLLQEKTYYEGDELPQYNDKSGVDGIYKIQPNDYLYINITSLQGINASFFNASGGGETGGSSVNAENQNLVGYYVNDSGYIYFPYVGNVYLWGKTIDEARRIMENQIKKFLKEPVVNVKLLNNTISIIGEVNNQGTYAINKAKINIYEAVTLAGGFTDFAKRSKVKLIRGSKRGSKVQIIDMSDQRIVDTELYYVYPNDLIYVEPMKAKTWGIGPTFSLALLSSITSLITLYVLIRTL